MALFDFLKKPKFSIDPSQLPDSNPIPDERKSLPVKFSDVEIGISGTLSTGGIFHEEYLNELIGQDAAIKFDKMRRSDPQVRKLISSVINPIKSATWTIEANENDPEEVQANLIRQILFQDLPGGWNAKLGEVLTFLPFGHSVFEIVHANKETPEIGKYTGLKNIAFRSQKTIWRWIRDMNTGQLLELYQIVNGDTPKTVMLPVDFLLIFYNEREGDDNGFPMLRPLYGCYKRKLLNLQLLAIGNERHAVGTVIASMPSDSYKDDAEVTAVNKMLDAFTSHDTSYILKPDTVSLTLENNNFDSTKLEASIKAEDERMAGAWLASFLELGIGGNAGAFALGDNLSAFFMNSIVQFGKIITEKINSELIPHLISLNFPGVPASQCPKLKVDGISDKAGKDMAEVIQILLNSKAVTNDEKLETFVREIFNLPDADPTTADKYKIAPVIPPIIPTPEPKLSVKISNPSDLISVAGEEVQELMRRNLSGMRDKLIADVMNKYKNLPDSQKIKAAAGLVAGKTAQYKTELRGKLTDLTVKALDQVKGEIPGFDKVKFGVPQDEGILLAAKEMGIKLAESGLPIRIKVLLGLQANDIVDKQAQDLTSKVSFAFQSSEGSTNDPDIIKKDLSGATDEYINSGSVVAAGDNVSAMMVNETRNAFFDLPDVSAQIATFTFMNSSPETDICKYLAGKTFNKNDAEAFRYQPPLHHNCKTWIRANLVTARNLPEINTGGIHPPASAMKSITLSVK